VCKLTHIDKKCSFKIHATKKKIVAFRGKFPIRTNIVIDNEPFEQASHFTYVATPHTTLIKMLRWNLISTHMCTLTLRLLMSYIENIWSS